MITYSITEKNKKMGFFDKLFGGLFGKSKKEKLDSKPSTFGGNGTSPQEAVVVNCASMCMASRIIDDFISDRHGEKGDDWNREFEMFHSSPIEDGPIIRMVGFKLSKSESLEYYFNIIRPMGATIDLIDSLENEGKI